MLALDPCVGKLHLWHESLFLKFMSWHALHIQCPVELICFPFMHSKINRNNMLLEYLICLPFLRINLILPIENDIAGINFEIIKIISLLEYLPSYY